MKDITLVILAGGMGSRFGGLKQIEPMGPNGEFIIDYSVYDAIKAGFNKIVFIIKEESYQVFKETIGKRVEPHIKVEYVFQKNDNIPLGFEIPKDRVKPLGTAHAILCCKDVVKEDFAIINADDLYGRDSYIKAAEFLKKNHDNKKAQHYGLVGYLVKNTITEYGAVKRGICKVSGDKLEALIESNVEKINESIIARPLDGSDEFEVDGNDTVSLNMLLFNPTIFNYIEASFPNFLEDNKNNLDKCEYLIPDVLFDTIKDNFASVSVLKTTATWYGVTYKEDAEGVKKSIKQLIDNHEYKNNLWD